jgi:hypothetical protein
VDEREAITEKQLAKLDKSVQPVRLMLVKVRVNFQTQLRALTHHTVASCLLTL